MWQFPIQCCPLLWKLSHTALTLGIFICTNSDNDEQKSFKGAARKGNMKKDKLLLNFALWSWNSFSMGQNIYNKIASRLPCIFLCTIIYGSHTKTCNGGTEGDFENAYDYLLHQIIRKAVLREIIQNFKQNLVQRYKQGFSVPNYRGIIYGITRILFTVKTLAEMKKHS